MSNKSEIQSYNDALAESDKVICNFLCNAIIEQLPDAEYKIWHAHPVWFNTIESTFGEKNGKTLSTPTPSEILRTVKLAVAPVPCFLITSPLKDWILSLLPSIIL